MAFLAPLLAAAPEAGAAAGAAGAGAGAAGAGAAAAEGGGLGSALSGLEGAQKIAGLASMFSSPRVQSPNMTDANSSIVPRRKVRMF